MKMHKLKFHREFYKCGRSKKKKQEAFPCPFCDFEMSQATDLPKHIMSYHSSKEKEIIVKT